MHILSINETKSVNGARARMSGSFSSGPNGTVFREGFYIEVTDNSANILGNFAAYADKVIDRSTNEVLFDGSQSSFCINGNTFQTSPVENGYRYTYIGSC